MSRMQEHLYLVGHPVAHSKSPCMYNAIYTRLGLPWHYDFMDCATEDAARSFFTSAAFLALNITTPYKPLALEAASLHDTSAILAHGANVLIRTKRGLVAYNTDGWGGVFYLKRTGFCFAGSKVVLCGTGPTALSLLHAIVQAGAREIALVGRSEERTMNVLKAYLSERERQERMDIELAGSAPCAASFPLLSQGSFSKNRRSNRGAISDSATLEAYTYKHVHQVLSQADLIINATPLGMSEHDPAPCDTTMLSPSTRVFDAVYGRGETALIAAARKAGCRAYDGAGMLVAQAVATVELVCGTVGVSLPFSEEELFDYLAYAAGFSF